MRNHLLEVYSSPMTSAWRETVTPIRLSARCAIISRSILRIGYLHPIPGCVPVRITSPEYSAKKKERIEPISSHRDCADTITTIKSLRQLVQCVVLHLDAKCDIRRNDIVREAFLLSVMTSASVRHSLLSLNHLIA
jgi:hypothetical protein